jgi:uncharacterized membrane protein YgaE (UPF0421/DUF939 family)
MVKRKSRRKIESLPDDAIIGFKIEVNDGNTPKTLAIKLAEAMQNSINYRNDARAFREHSQFEVEKAKNLKRVLVQLKEREKNPPTKVSRMDPLAEYNKEAVEQEIDQAMQRCREFAEMANDRETDASQEDQKAIALQRDIRELNDSG